MNDAPLTVGLIDTTVLRAAIELAADHGIVVASDGTLRFGEDEAISLLELKSAESTEPSLGGVVAYVPDIEQGFTELPPKHYSNKPADRNRMKRLTKRVNKKGHR